MSDTKTLNFHTVDETTMKGDVVKKLVALRKAQKSLAEAKASFEAEFIKTAREADMLRPEDSLAFGYRFGRLAVAIVRADTKPKASAKPKFSFY